jgi:hypothetical protein
MRVPTMRTLNDCNRLTETQREYWMAGLGLIVANHWKSVLQDIPPYCFISVTKYELTGADGASTMAKTFLPTKGNLSQPYTDSVSNRYG